MRFRSLSYRHFPLILLASIFLLLVLIVLQAKSDLPTSNSSTDNDSITPTPRKKPRATLDDVYLYGQKLKRLEKAEEGKMFFGVETKNLAKNLWQVEITLEGDPDVIADAADLKLDLSDSIEIIEVETGNAFTLYPRKVIKGNSVLTTGAASIEENAASSAKAGTVFVTLKLQTIKNNTENKLSVDSQESKIFFNTANIFDENKGIKIIKLR